MSISPTPCCLIVLIDQQKLFFYQDGRLVKVYPISTSRRSPSCQQDSLGTPWGMHRVEEKIGNGEPVGMVFRGRVPIGKRYWELEAEEQEHCLITTRILRLRGLEPGLNAGKGCDTYERMVYIHGTNQEENLGRPASHGCVVMDNREVIELFDAVDSGSLVLVLRNSG